MSSSRIYLHMFYRMYSFLLHNKKFDLKST